MQGSISGYIIDRKVIIRADGNKKTGFGHIYRMLALIEMIRGCASHIVFVTQKLPDLLSDTIAALEIEHKIVNDPDLDLPDKQDQREITVDLELTGGELVILDGYHFGKQYQQSVKERGCKLIYIDDFGGNEFNADVIINHAPGVSYPELPNVKMFSGIDYAMLRTAFFTPFKRSQLNKVAYICMGGSDFFGYSLILLDLISEHGDFESINLLISSQYPDELVKKLLDYQTRTQFKLHIDLNAEELVSLLDNSTHAFVSASTVLLECYSRGMKCYTGYYSNNQSLIYNGFVREKKAIGLGDFASLDSDTFRKRLNQLPKELSKPLQSRDNLLEILSSL